MTETKKGHKAHNNKKLGFSCVNALYSSALAKITSCRNFYSGSLNLRILNQENIRAQN